MAWADRFTAQLASEDGLLYRVRVLLDGAASSAELELAEDGVVLRRGRTGDPDLYEPVPGSELSVTFIDLGTGALSEVVSAPFGRYYVVLEYYHAGSDAWKQVWEGFALPGRYQDAPFSERRRVTLRAVEPWLKLKPVDTSDFDDVNSPAWYLFAALQSGAFGLPGPDGDGSASFRTAGLWRPWLPVPQTADDDPLAAVLAPTAALVDDRGEPLDLLAMAQEVWRAFGLRCVQSEGGVWWLALRDALRGGSATTWTYDVPAGSETSGPDATDLVFDEAAEIAAGRLRLEAEPQRETTAVVRKLTVAYATPSAENLVVNGSFETAGGGGAQYAEGWTNDPAAGAQRRLISDLVNTSYTAGYGNERLAVLFGHQDAGDVGFSQSGLALIPGGGSTVEAANCLRLTALVVPLSNAVPIASAPAKLYLSAEDETARYYLTGGAVVAGGTPNAVKGALAVEPLFGGVSGAVAGTLALPKGTRLLFRDTGESEYDPVTFTLERPARVGDTVLYGTPDGLGIEAGFEALACYWGTARAAVPLYEWFTGVADFAPEDHAAVLIAPDGTVLDDAELAVEIEHPYLVSGMATSPYDEDFQALFDDLRVEVWTGADEDGGGSGRSASFRYISEGAGGEGYGIDVELQDVLVGDGPTTESATGLQARDGDGNFQPTMQGADTGWKAGVYEAAEASTGEAFVELRGRTERETQAVALQRRLFTARFRGITSAQRFRPEQVWRHAATGRLAAAALADDETVTVYEPLRDDMTLTLAGTEYTVIEVTGSGPFVVTLDPPLAAGAEAGEAFAYGLDLVWDYTEWRVGSAALRFEGTELLPLPAGSGIYRIPLTINASQVAENASDFPVFVDLSEMPTEFWDAVRADGGDVRAYTAGGSTSGAGLPLDLVHIDAALQRGELWVKVPSVSTAADVEFCLEVGDPALTAQPAADAPLGSQAVWPAEYMGVYHLHWSLDDATANARHMALWGDIPIATGGYHMAATSPEVGAHQGVCFDGTHYYVVDTNAIKKYDASWSLVATNADPLGDIAGAGGPTLNHLGDPAIRGGVLYIPVENYVSSCGVGTGDVHVVRFAASDLNYVGITDLSATATEGSSCCFVPAAHSPSGTEELWVANYCTAGRVHRYAAATYAHLGDLTYDNPGVSVPVENLQGIDFFNGAVLLMTTTGLLFEATPSGGAVTRILYRDPAAGITNEGIWAGEDADGPYVLMLREVESPTSQRVVTLRPAGFPSTTGAAGLGIETNRYAATSSFVVNQDPISFTAYANPSQLAANACVVSYVDTTQAGSVNQRAVLVFRAATGKWGLWDKTNTWLDGTTNASLYRWDRLTAALDPGGNRRLIVNGVQEASAAIAALPTGLRNVWVGREDSDGNEPWRGGISDLFIRSVAVSAGRDLTEHRNRTQFATFITVGAAVEV